MRFPVPHRGCTPPGIDARPRSRCKRSPHGRDPTPPTPRDRSCTPRPSRREPRHRAISRYRRWMRHARLAVAAILIAATLATPAAAAGLEPRPFLDDLAFPTNMAFLPDGTLLFTEKETGNVRVVAPDGELVDQPFITLPVIADAERGLLGIAVHPDFERDPWIYLYRSDPADGLNRLVRVRADRSGRRGQPETLLDGISAVAGYHNGGDLAFAADGSLFVALGEAHEADRAQDENDIGGKIVAAHGRRGRAAGQPVRTRQPRLVDRSPQLVRPLRRPSDRDALGDGERPRRRRRGEPDRAGRQLRLAGVTGVSDDDRFVDPARWSSATRSPSPGARSLAATCGSARSTAGCGGARIGGRRR